MSAPRAGLPDPKASRAVQVGASEYTTLEALPSVAGNVAALGRALTAADLWELPNEHCVTLPNPTSVEQVLDAVHLAASAAEDALLFYFAGHGLLDGRSDLHLALPGSDGDRLYRAVRYDGSAKPTTGYGIPEQARRVTAVLDQLGVRHAAVVGHSTWSRRSR